MKILIMRPSPEGEELVKNLNNIGIVSWHFSLFDFYPSTSAQNLSRKINELYQSDIILVFSKRSIYYTHLYLTKNHLRWPSYPRYYTIGKSTAIFLYQYIKKKIFFPQNRENSENLLKILNKDQLKNTKIILLQGENGREFIKKNLIKKRLQFCVIECYKKVLKKLNRNLEVQKWRFYKINSLVVTNAQTLNELSNVILNIDQSEWLLRCKIFVVGKRLKNIARRLGWRDIVISNYANNEHLLKVINQNRY